MMEIVHLEGSGNADKVWQKIRNMEAEPCSGVF